MTTSSSDPKDLVPRDAAELTRLGRDDVAALATSSRLRARSSPWFGAAPPAAGVAAFFGTVALQELGGVVALTTPLCVATGVAVAIGVATRAWRRERRRRAAYAWACPACGFDIVSPQPFVDDSAQTAAVISTACCPSCGARILAD